MSAYSLYIPSVYNNITEHMISETFHRMNVGKVKHVEFISKKNGNAPKKAYIFFDSLYQSDLAMDIYDNVNEGKTAKLPYGRSQHVFWILLKCQREYDGKSNVGEYIEPDFTEEEMNFMEQQLQEQQLQEQNEDFSLVSSDYANTLEQEIHNLRLLNVQLQNNYVTAFNSHAYLKDKMDKWTELGMNHQGDRLCNLIQRENNAETCAVEL